MLKNLRSFAYAQDDICNVYFQDRPQGMAGRLPVPGGGL